MNNGYTDYYKELCPSEESWVHRQLSDEREEFEDEISKLRAELATERARLDFVEKHGFEHKHHETGDHLAYEWTVTTVSEDKYTNLRATIDAAMKENAK